MATIRLERIQKSFGEVEVIRGVDLTIADGEFMVFVGPSGCGKSTVLRLIAGLESLSGGNVYIGDRRVNDVEPRDRNVAMVFQNYALYPHMTVRDNIDFGLKLRGVSKAERESAVKRAAELLGIGELLNRRPRELSGGQRQRVAMGRCIVRDPAVFLMDEPLSNLDAKLRNHMRVEIKQLQRDLTKTMVYVTHDQIEAMTLADRILVLDAGRVSQIGTPDELYSHPANLFVAGFIGTPSMNFVPARRAGERRLELSGGVALELPAERAAMLNGHGESYTVGIRPENVEVVGEPGDASRDGAVSGRVTWEEKVRLCEPLGGETLLYTAMGEATMHLKVTRRGDIREGSRLRFGFDEAGAHIFGENGECVSHAVSEEG